ncbi:MAG: helix-turn-helix transcriptional regulator [Pseudomonadota bacterium]
MSEHANVQGDTVTIPKAEYEALLADAALVERQQEAWAAAAYEAYLRNPGEGLPDVFMGRLLDDEPPLRVFRDWRGLTQQQLADASGVSRVQIAEIETGRKTGSVATLRKLADALRVTMDELVPTAT